MNTFYAVHLRPWIIASKALMPRRSFLPSTHTESTMKFLGLSVTVERRAGRMPARRVVPVIGMTIAVVLAGGVAYAYWSATGTGSGAAQASSAIDATVVATSAVDAALWPGNATAVPVKFTVNNPNPYPVSYSTFNTAVISSVTPVSGTCATSDFQLTATSGSLASPVAVPVGSSTPAGTTANILQMKATAGDGCQGAAVNVTLKVAGTQTP